MTDYYSTVLDTYTVIILGTAEEVCMSVCARVLWFEIRIYKVKKKLRRSIFLKVYFICVCAPK